MVNETKAPETSEDLVIAAIKTLQRGLPGRVLDDRGVVTVLWGIFDGPAARDIYHRIEPPDVGARASSADDTPQSQ